MSWDLRKTCPKLVYSRLSVTAPPVRNAPSSPRCWQRRHQQRRARNRQQRCAERMGHERAEITVREDQCAIEVVTNRLTEHEPEQQRRRLEAPSPQQVSDDPEDRGKPQIERAVIERVDSGTRQRNGRRIQEPVRHPYQSRPPSHQRQVEDEQHHVADPHARDETPEQRGFFRDHARSRLNAVHDQRAKKQRADRAGREAEREKRDE